MNMTSDKAEYHYEGHTVTPEHTGAIAPYLVQLLVILYRKHHAKVKVAGTLSRAVKEVVRKGCVISPYIFNGYEESHEWFRWRH